MVKTSDGGYALAGYTYLASNMTADFWLLKVNSTGGVQWSRTYGGAYNEYVNSVVQTGDGGYALAGWASSATPYGLVMKVNSTGGLQWNFTYGATVNDQFASVVQTSDGGYAVAGVHER